MGEQRRFASVACSRKGKVTRRERFLAEMDAVIPWKPLLGMKLHVGTDCKTGRVAPAG